MAGSVAAALALGLAGWCPSASERAGRRRRGGVGSHEGSFPLGHDTLPYPRYEHEHGSPYTRFRRALAARNPLLLTAAALELELGRLSLADALAVCLVFRDHDRARYGPVLGFVSPGAK